MVMNHLQVNVGWKHWERKCFHAAQPKGRDDFQEEQLKEIPDLVRYCKPRTEQSLRISCNIPEQGHREGCFCLSSCFTVPSPIFCQCTIEMSNNRINWHDIPVNQYKGQTEETHCEKQVHVPGYLSALLLDAMPLCRTQPTQPYMAAPDSHHASEVPCFLLNLEHIPAQTLSSPPPALCWSAAHSPLRCQLDITFLSCSLDQMPFQVSPPYHLELNCNCLFFGSSLCPGSSQRPLNLLLFLQCSPQGWAQNGHLVHVCCKMERGGRGEGKEKMESRQEETEKREIGREKERECRRGRETQKERAKEKERKRGEKEKEEERTGLLRR